MPVAMPIQPPVLSRAAPAASAAAHPAVAAAMESARRVQAVRAGGRPTAAALLPPLDLSSPSLTRADRGALLAAWRGEEGRGASSTYVADRIALGRMVPAMLRGTVDAASARCMVVQVALERASGRYLEGGERAAAAVRAAAAPEAARCGGLRAQAAALVAEGTCAQPPVRVDPVARRTAPVHVDPIARRTPPVHVDPVARRTAPVHVDPIARRTPPVHLDLVAFATSHAKGGPATDVDPSVLQAMSGRAGRGA